LENRARFILEIVAAIKAKLPSNRFVIAVKLSCHDCKKSVPAEPSLVSRSMSSAVLLTFEMKFQPVIEGGQSFAEQCVVIKWLEDAGVDFFDISGGTYESPAWRGNIMKELALRVSQRERGRYISSQEPFRFRWLTRF
jgi:2,4-dienoyl-CoA reductase-like NADH-dependent reductase (Old Yellow Enzyme family)